MVNPASRTIAAHRVGIDWIITRQHYLARSFRHKDMLALTIDGEAGLLQSVNRSKVINARKLRHYRAVTTSMSRISQ